MATNALCRQRRQYGYVTVYVSIAISIDISYRQDAQQQTRTHAVAAVGQTHRPTDGHSAVSYTRC